MRTWVAWVRFPGQRRQKQCGKRSHRVSGQLNRVMGCSANRPASISPDIDVAEERSRHRGRHPAAARTPTHLLGLAAQRRLPRHGKHHVLPPTGRAGHERETRINNAKAVCRTCPVRTECLEHALKIPEPYGIWGGLSEDERAQLLGVHSLRYPARVTPAR